MVAILIDNEDRQPSRFLPARLSAGGGARNEKWLQALLFENPELVILDRVETRTGEFVPLVREFPLQRAEGTVFLDILGVSRSGRLVLIECKLWRNPQARREVIAQTLEYAALARGLTYGDLTAKVKQGRRNQPSANPIYDLARDRWPDLDESAFVDAVSRSLDVGDFYLIVAGDGIRSDLHAISDHLNSSGLAAARFSLLDIQLWEDGRGRMLIVPTVPVRTEVIRQRVLIGDAGRALRIEDEGDSLADSSEQVVDPEQAAQRLSNRAFWQRFIDGVQFDHPDQFAPRHGGNNWVRIPLPEPVKSMTAYRGKDKIGFLIALSGDRGFPFYEWLEAQATAISRDNGVDLQFEPGPAGSNKGQVNVAIPKVALADEAAQQRWLRDTANKLVTLLRPMISRWEDGGGA